MGFFSNLLGPSREEVWRGFARAVRGQYKAGSFFSGPPGVEAPIGPWMLTLDSFTRSSGSGSSRSSTTYTRLRLPYCARRPLRFQVYRTHFLSGLGKALGFQDITVGDRRFDEAFVVKGEDPKAVRSFLDDRSLLRLVDRVDRGSLAIREDDGWLGSHLPDGVDELAFTVPSIIRDQQRLLDLHALFSAAAERLCETGFAERADPRVSYL